MEKADTAVVLLNIDLPNRRDVDVLEEILVRPAAPPNMGKKVRRLKTPALNLSMIKAPRS